MIPFLLYMNIYGWVIFLAFIVLMLIIDLGIFNREAHTISYREALTWSLVWIILALLFNLGLYFYLGYQIALEFFTGYILEKSLSVDNIFVFLVIFSYFKVETKYQHKILFWGVVGAIIMRGIFIVLGAALLIKFHWIIYIFGIFLIYTGIKMAFQKDNNLKPEELKVVKLAKKYFRFTDRIYGSRFFVKENLKTVATPLFIVLIVVETMDLVFAFDSIPAILAITNDTFVVFTSNIFAILGLRALYFALAGVMDKFKFLKYGLAVILTFIGIKMLISGVFKIPTLISLLVIVLILIITILASIFSKGKIQE
ncbi:MAG: TerC family protein [Ignavibacteria bacterium]